MRRDLERIEVLVMKRDPVDVPPSRATSPVKECNASEPRRYADGNMTEV